MENETLVKHLRGQLYDAIDNKEDHLVICQISSSLDDILFKQFQRINGLVPTAPKEMRQSTKR